MSSDSDTQDALLKLYGTDAIESMEGGSPTNPSFAHKGNSGMSFGKLQNDVRTQGVSPITGLSAAGVLTQALTDYAASPANTSGLTAAMIQSIVATAATKGITRSGFGTTLGTIAQQNGVALPANFDAVGVMSASLAADASLVQAQDDAAADRATGKVATVLDLAQDFPKGAGVLDPSNLDPTAITALAAWANQHGNLIDVVKTLKNVTTKGGPSTQDVLNAITSDPAFSKANTDKQGWLNRVNNATSLAKADLGGNALSVAFPSPVPVADSDGDASSLSDLIGGPGAEDPDEGAEGDEQLANVGGQAVDMRATSMMHTSGFNADINQMTVNILGEFGISLGGTPNSVMAQPAGQPFSLFQQTLGAEQLSIATNLNSVQDDPFDPNYRTTFTPVTPPPVSISAIILTGASTTLNAQLRTDMTTALTAEGKAASDANAIYVTQNRMYSAYGARDLKAFAAQVTSMNGFVAAFSADEAAASKASAAVVTDLSRAGANITTNTTAIASLITQFQASGTTALSDQQQAVLQLFVPDQGDQASATALLGRATASSVPTTLTSSLQATATTEAALSKLVAIPALTNPSVPYLPSLTDNVFRFFDTKYGTHFFTSDPNESANIQATRADLKFEGTGLLSVDPNNANDPNASPVYRFFDTKFGTHFFTASAAERDGVIASRPDLTFEGTGFYEHTTQQPNDTPVYRFFDTQFGTHFYTNDASERANILATRPDLKDEGIGFYAPSS